MKEIILQKCNFRCRENIYICRPLRRLRRLAVEYVKKYNFVCFVLFFTIRSVILRHYFVTKPLLKWTDDSEAYMPCLIVTLVFYSLLCFFLINVFILLLFFLCCRLINSRITICYDYATYLFHC